jgi:hypothetical protein
MYEIALGARSRVSWLRHYAASRKVGGSSVDEVDFFNLLNPSRCDMALGSTQPLTKLVLGIFLRSKVRLARKADNLTAICEPIA